MFERKRIIIPSLTSYSKNWVKIFLNVKNTAFINYFLQYLCVKETYLESTKIHRKNKFYPRHILRPRGIDWHDCYNWHVFFFVPHWIINKCQIVFFYHSPSENCDLFLVITKVGLVESYNLSWILAKFNLVTRYLSSFMAVFGVSLSLMTKMRNYFIARFWPKLDLNDHF